MTAKSMPSPKSGTPKVKRSWLELTSMPISPSSMPARIMAIALITEPCARITAATRPNSRSEK